LRIFLFIVGQPAKSPHLALFPTHGISFSPPLLSFSEVRADWMTCCFFFAFPSIFTPFCIEFSSVFPAFSLRAWILRGVLNLKSVYLRSVPFLFTFAWVYHRRPESPFFSELFLLPSLHDLAFRVALPFPSSPSRARPPNSGS